MIAPARQTPTRVVLGATCFADAQSAIALAVELAKHLDAEVHGLLVQDEAVLNALSIPAAPAITFSGERSGNVTPAAMLAAFRADARQFETQLLRSAAAEAVEFGFRATQGRLPRIMEQTALAGDLMIIGYRRNMRNSGDLVLVLGKDGEVDGPDRIAAELSTRLGKNLTVFVPKGHAAKARHELGRQGVSPSDIREYEDASALLSGLNRMSPVAVIAGFEQPDLPAVARLLDVARCPVILSCRRDQAQKDG